MNGVMRFCVLVLIASGALLPEAVGALQHGYSPMAQYLSELSAQGAPYAQLITYGSLLPIGISIIVLVFGLYGKFSHRPMAQVGVIFLLGISVGYFGAFFFPCAPGCPANGDGHQLLHNLGGLIEYTGAITGLVLIFFGLKSSATPVFSTLTLAVAALVSLGFIMMINPDMGAWRGAWQRLAEYALVVWFAGVVFIKSIGPDP